MALLSAVGTFSLGTGAVASTVSVTGLPFQPKVVLFALSGRTAAGHSEQDHKLTFGYAVSSTDRGGVTSQSDHGAAVAAADGSVYSTEAIKLLTIAGAVDGRADFDAWLSDGFRLVIDDQFAANYLVNYLALGGDDITNVGSATLTVNATGNIDITSLGFQPDAAVLFGGGVAALDAVDTWSNISLGVAAGGTPSNYVVAGASSDGSDPMVTMDYCRTGESFACLGVDLVAGRGSISQWLSNGFRFNCVERAGTDVYQVRVLCIKGGSWAVGDLMTALDTNPFSESGLSFTPKALLLASRCRPQSTADTTQGHEEISVGFAKSATERCSVGMFDRDGAGTADIGVSQHTDNLYSARSTAATIAIEGLMDLVSMDSGGFTVVMDDADPVQNFVWYLAAGDTPAAGNRRRRVILGS